MIVITKIPGEITVSGHAGYAELGKDIVCAAVSTLLQTYVASIRELTEDTCTAQLKAGESIIKYGNLSEKAKTLMDSFFVGVNMIADVYPENVRVEIYY